MSHLLTTLQSLHTEINKIVNDTSSSDYLQQTHADLSPIGWHLGHCVYTELYWVQEQLLGKQIISDELKSIYVPELSIKQSRGSALPDKLALLSWAKNTQKENCKLLEIATRQHPSNKLLKNGYIFHFLIQHYSQHIETIMMALTEKQIERKNPSVIKPIPIISKQKKQDIITIDSGTHTIGFTGNTFSYDNEQPEQVIELDKFNIATRLVSNSEYLGFINAEAYKTKEFWSNAAWDWLNKTQHTHPHHWQQDKGGYWYGIDHLGGHSLKNDEPVYGLSHFEAAAYARWFGGRLPHEYEWEVANKQCSLQNTGQVWEWCNNTFHPYNGFSPYPYVGYSAPYFDGSHYVLKGGSRYTKSHIKRPSFRNYYTPDKRHIFAGLRLVYD